LTAIIVDNKSQPVMAVNSRTANIAEMNFFIRTPLYYESLYFNIITHYTFEQPFLFETIHAKLDIR